jgi:hypothetical protein
MPGRYIASPIPVLRSDVVSHGLGFLVMVVFAVSVPMSIAVTMAVIVRRSDIIHSVNASALGAALKGTFAGWLMSPISHNLQVGHTNIPQAN